MTIGGETLPNIVTYPPLTSNDFAQLCTQYELKIQAELQRFLMSTNGARSNDGYFRIFGLGPQAEIDSVNWNALNTWKFAWPARVQEFWCFGETAWGDQYAFK